MKQTTVFDEIFIDSFAGGGGASTGIELATGHPVDIAINHDESAILMHRANHPYTRHYREDIWSVDPVEATQGRRVRLMWASPDCKHFSRAKGAALVDKKIRGLAWVILRWAAEVQPDIIMVENVPEFTTWGPVRKGKPVKRKAGQTFGQWKKQFEDLGYEIQYRELVAADYGAPTIRKRFCLIARRDGQPIRWPERTHAPAGSPEVLSGKCKPWRSAAEIIDWSLPCLSIFDSKKQIKATYGISAVRPLADNTLQRVIRGVDKFTLKSGKPFIVNAKFDNAPESVDNPLSTMTAVRSHYIVAPSLMQYHASDDARGQTLDNPLCVIDTSNRHSLVTAQLTEWYGNPREGIDITLPMQTITAKDREALTIAHITQYKGKSIGQAPQQPLNTITANDGEFGIIAGHVTKFKGTNIGHPAGDPLQTITAGGGEFGEVRTTLVKYSGQPDLHHWPEIRSLLNKYCGYHIADDEILLIVMCRAYWYLSDIGLRMLIPRELYNAQGFPEDYIIDRDIFGNAITRSKQVEKVGNSVCPPMAEALVRANLPEYSHRHYSGMKDLKNAMSS